MYGKWCAILLLSVVIEGQTEMEEKLVSKYLCFSRTSAYFQAALGQHGILINALTCEWQVALRLYTLKRRACKYLWCTRSHGFGEVF